MELNPQCSSDQHSVMNQQRARQRILVVVDGRFGVDVLCFLVENHDLCRLQLDVLSAADARVPFVVLVLVAGRNDSQKRKRLKNDKRIKTNTNYQCRQSVVLCK